MIESLVEGALGGLLFVVVIRVHAGRLAHRLTDGQRDAALTVAFAAVGIVVIDRAGDRADEIGRLAAYACTLGGALAFLAAFVVLARCSERFRRCFAPDAGPRPDRATRHKSRRA